MAARRLESIPCSSGVDRLHASVGQGPEGEGPAAGVVEEDEQRTERRPVNMIKMGSLFERMR
jgi:hypothetical protein